MFSVACHHLTKTFSRDGRPIRPVDDLTLTFEASSIHAIIGESGCGKTTLLRLIAGLLTPDRGEICFEPASQRPKISIVFQEPRLFPWLNVRDNIRLSVRHDSRALQEQKIDEVLELVGLTDFAQLVPAELSGGMAQRVGLARALCPQPDLLLLDEAFSALDALTRSRIYGEFIRIHEVRPVTTILVTHDVMEAVLLSSHVHKLHQGRLQKSYRIDLPYPRTLATPGVGVLSETIFHDFMHQPQGD